MENYIIFYISAGVTILLGGIILLLLQEYFIKKDKEKEV